MSTSTSIHTYLYTVLHTVPSSVYGGIWVCTPVAYSCATCTDTSSGIYTYTLRVASLGCCAGWYIYLWYGILQHAMVHLVLGTTYTTYIHAYPLVHGSGIRVHGWYIGIVLLQGILYMHYIL